MVRLEMTERAEFYQKHLDLVSRSFAFCIARLSSPLREQIGLSYLICRILDSIEDATWADKNAQASQFLQFDRFLLQPFTDSEIKAWTEKFPINLSVGERSLVNDSAVIFRDFQALPDAVREAIAEPVLSMSRGMLYFTGTTDGNRTQLKLTSLQDVNRYCFFVAGVVGEILTRLVAISRGAYGVSESQLVNAFHFGLFLQKVNLLKDQRGDEAQGRFLVPSRPELLASLKEHAIHALDYVTSIPKTLLPFRLFCSWSLFLGLASLPWIESSYQRNDASKIPRVETESLLAEIEGIADDDVKLEELFKFLLQFIDENRDENRDENNGKSGVEPSLKAASDEDFPRLYHGLLPTSQLSMFGLA